MKKCLFCGTEVNDDCLFCTECGKELPKGNVCPHCGASVNDGDVFCMECGKKIYEVPNSITKRPKCPHCGANVDNNASFCTNCGKNINEGSMSEKQLTENLIETNAEKPEEPTQDFNYSYVEEEPKTWRDYKLPIFGGIFIIIFLGAGWWYWDSSNRRVDREKVIADSLEIVRQDSVKAAELREKKERKENERRLKLEACKNYVEKFYNEYERTDNADEYLRQHCTYKALNTLKEKYPYDCDEGGCLATWIFFYEAGTDAEIVSREFIAVDENTCKVRNVTNYGSSYIVKIRIVEEDSHFMIDEIDTSSEN